MTLIVIAVSLLAWSAIGFLLVKQICGEADTFQASLAIAVAFGVWLLTLLLTI